MEDTSKVRLIRCPKCDYLLPELPDYSVYQCGACGTFLRAKKKGNLDVGKGLERSDEENNGLVSEISDNLSGKSEDLVGKGRFYGVENGNGRVGGSEYENVNLGESDLVNRNLSKVNRLEIHVDNANGLRKPGRVFEGNLSDTREKDRFGTRRGYLGEMRSSSSNYVGRCPSNYNLDSNYKREASRATRAEEVEPDREELLRKLGELEDQLSRVQNGNNNYREKLPTEHRIAPLETYVESEDYYRQMADPSTFYRVSRQYSAPNKHFSDGPPYVDQYHEPFALHHRSHMATNSHNSIHGSSYSPRYEDSFESQIFRRPPQRIPNHHQYMSPELDHFESHPYGTTLGHLSCSCYRCYDRQHQVSKFPHVPNTPALYHHKIRGAFGSRGFNSSLVTPPSGSCELKPHTRWQSDLKLERNGRSHPQKAVLGKGRHYRPVASGAPFVTCRNCFELLKLPKKVISKMGEWQLSCAACSFVMSFAIVDEKLASVDTSAKQTNAETIDDLHKMAREHLKQDNGSYCSEDYANSGYDFQAMDRDPSLSSTCYSLSSIKSEEMRNILSVSCTTSEDERLSDDLASANLNSRSDHQEEVITNKKSLKEALATEIEISPNEYADTRLSKVASDNSREDDELKSKKGDSFFAGILKKSFRSNPIVESAKKNIMVNGNLIPDRLVKKAEKLTGSVYPGQYWYDYRAGFWGVIGGPCLGIVPPFIEEFNYPMPEKCGAGNTGVYINGRELNENDLKLLSTRGLPPSKDRSYIVDISGRVVDEDTGEELVSLGKLAPTIEKVKHGFGMRAPKAIP